MNFMTSGRPAFGPRRAHCGSARLYDHVALHGQREPEVEQEARSLEPGRPLLARFAAEMHQQ